MNQLCSHMCTEMPNLKANFLTSLTKEVNPERPVEKNDQLISFHPDSLENQEKI